MGVVERKARERSERRWRIVRCAREVAEREGWDFVTIRRLADEIEYSQPVLYSHFENRDAIIRAVALQGFREIAETLRKARRLSHNPKSALARVAEAYLGFAAKHAALYEAMFTLPTGLRFAEDDAEPELRAGFALLEEVVAPYFSETDTAAEFLWAALHGLAELDRSRRTRKSHMKQRIALLIDAITARARH